MKFISGNSLRTTSVVNSSSTSIPLCTFLSPLLLPLPNLSLPPLTPQTPSPNPLNQTHSAKLLLAFQGYLISYTGHFDFENIGDSYLANKVPYVSLRALPAFLGSLVPVVVYGIMRESGYPVVVGVLSSSLVLLGQSSYIFSLFVRIFRRRVIDVIPA